MGFKPPIFDKPWEPAPGPSDKQEVVEVYPDELPKVNAVTAELNRMFQAKIADDAGDWLRLRDIAREKFHEIGFIVDLEVYEVQKKLDDGRMVPVVNAQGIPVYAPNLIFLGRTNPEYEVDHDRIKHGIVTGKVDGVKGYIREGSDGLHEEPIKKIIT